MRCSHSDITNKCNGQCNLSDPNHILSELGRRQATLTGKRSAFQKKFIVRMQHKLAIHTR